MHSGHVDSVDSSDLSRILPNVPNHAGSPGASEALATYPSHQFTRHLTYGGGHPNVSNTSSWYPSFDLSAGSTRVPPPLPTISSFYRPIPQAELADLSVETHPQSRGRSQSSASRPPVIPKRWSEYTGRDLPIPSMIADLPPQPPLPPKLIKNHSTLGLHLFHPKCRLLLCPPPGIPPTSNPEFLGRQEDIPRPLPAWQPSQSSEPPSFSAPSPLPSASPVFPLHDIVTTPLPDDEEDEGFRRAIWESQRSYEEATKNSTLSSVKDGGMSSDLEVRSAKFNEDEDEEEDYGLRLAIQESLNISVTSSPIQQSESEVGHTSEETGVPVNPMLNPEVIATKYGPASPQSSLSYASLSSVDPPTPITTSPVSLSSQPFFHDIVPNTSSPDYLQQLPSYVSPSTPGSGGPIPFRTSPRGNAPLSAGDSQKELQLSSVPRKPSSDYFPQVPSYTPPSTSASKGLIPLRTSPRGDSQRDSQMPPNYAPRNSSLSHEPSSATPHTITSEGPRSDHFSKTIQQSMLLSPPSQVPSYAASVAPTTSPTLRTSPSYNSTRTQLNVPTNTDLTQYPPSLEPPRMRPRAGSHSDTVQDASPSISTRPPLARTRTLPDTEPSNLPPPNVVRPDLSQESYLGDLMRGVCSHPFPDEIPCEAHEAFFIAVPNFRQLLRLLASLGHAFVEASHKARMAIDMNEVYLRPTLQFVRRPAVTNEWVTVLWFEVAKPQNRVNGAGAGPVSQSLSPSSKSTDTSRRPYRTALPEAVIHNLGHGSQVFVCQDPLLPLPRKLPDVTIYLQNLLAESRRSNDSSGLRRLSKIVDSLYPKDDDAAREVGGQVQATGGRRVDDSTVMPGRKKGARGGNEEIYDLVTPFRLK
ncbi:uncharacterized protein EI90DRAFT_3052898 [Cantharellus anzutake]|uniref:uncharacterized protein n=1 Tax=Cantharellus anzutake TaxID=1750568 RepID=UPI00190379D0|nr:uncharacterized protein EI90DRAFT_3052898 [Cantharellus anzutake]KAF8333077.1 hypothetical protein EI90DRAFT_3052898 [Cantharellus anzutake]